VARATSYRNGNCNYEITNTRTRLVHTHIAANNLTQLTKNKHNDRKSEDEWNTMKAIKDKINANKLSLLRQIKEIQ
jgi:hypothetical protein